MLVAVMWTANITRQMLDPTFHPDPAVNAVFSTVIGAVITLGGKEKEQPKRTPKRRQTP